MKIYLNPGHGQTDPGAVNEYFGVNERDIVWSIAEKIYNILSENYDVILRQDDDLSYIVSECNTERCDLFVSIHCNACESHLGYGAETYSFYNSKTGRQLAENIQDSMCDTIFTLRNRGVREAGFFVLKYTSCPAVLVETAFIDHDSDLNLLLYRQDDYAESIAQGITKFIEQLEKGDD